MGNIQKIEAKKSLGQHFLNNEHVPKLMADAGAVSLQDVVVEIGPGTGMLTHELLSRGARVIGIETDKRAVVSLMETFEEEVMAKRLTIIHEDIRGLDLHTLPITEHGYKVVANIPYFLSGMLFRYFLESICQPSTLVFLVQKEVAERIARDKKESLLSLSVKAFGNPTYVKTISKGNFTPSPKVDSAIIAVRDISHDRFSEPGHVLSEKQFFEFLHIGFGSKRKQLMGNLAQTIDRNQLIHIFSTLGIQETIRSEDLSIEEWLKLSRAMAVHNVSTTSF